MEKNNILHTLQGERVTSIYAETYFNDTHCDYEEKIEECVENPEIEEDNVGENWISPSDLLIGIIELIPPFTSKISRGIAHKGILMIGDDLLKAEYERFQTYMNYLKRELEIVWNEILAARRIRIKEEIEAKYALILSKKRKKMSKEMDTFYEKTLQDLETHTRKEVSDAIITAYSNIINDLNAEIKKKLAEEKEILTKVLKDKYESEVKKIKHYYKIIIDNDICKNKKLLSQALYARNDALKAFYRQIEAETMTSTMYMMCTERKKCRIKQFLLDHYNTIETTEKHQKLKEKILLLESLKEKERHIGDVNKNWEDKIKKILQLFLKFVSFSMKLLPEQAVFLLDLEKLLVLQLNEIQKSPMNTSPILIDETDFNYFKFEEAEPEPRVCDKEPFTIIGDEAESVSTSYGSRETLASNVELPLIRLYRKFIYAKCDRYEEVADLLEAKRCKCHDSLPKPPVEVIPNDTTPLPTEPPSPPETESSYENLLIDNLKILHGCPARCCQDWIKKIDFPAMPEYEDFTEDNYKRVKTILGKQHDESIDHELIKPKDRVLEELPFASTKEKYHHAGTQYELEEDDTSTVECPCTGMLPRKKQSAELKESKVLTIDQILKKRKNSLKRIINSNPNLLKMFTDESFDFVYDIK